MSAGQVEKIAPGIAAFWEKAEFPHHLIPELAKLNLGGATLSEHGCAGQSILAAVRSLARLCPLQLLESRS